jgi:signal peptidase I
MKDIKKQPDMFGIYPKVGDIIVFNPPKYKGLVYGECVGFSDVGLPKLVDIKPWCTGDIDYDIQKRGFYTPKTGFVVKFNPF